jgi:hypothetical protein
VYFLFFSNSSSQIIFWNPAPERKSLCFKNFKLAALINVVIYHSSFKNSGRAFICSLYPLYGVFPFLIFINGTTHNNVEICAVSDVVQFATKFVNVIPSF